MGYIELLAEIDKQKRLQSLTNEDLHKATGLAVSTIAGFMTGKRYSENVASRLCNALGIAADYLPKQ